MKTALACMVVLGIVIVFGLAISWAADHGQKKPCEVLLNEATLRANAVSDERVTKERRIAELETALYMERQRRQAVEKELADLKKPQEEKKAE